MEAPKIMWLLKHPTRKVFTGSCSQQRICVDDVKYIRADIHQAKIQGLVEACEELAYELNSTPASGPVCWCDPRGSCDSHTEACQKTKAAVKEAKA